MNEISLLIDKIFGRHAVVARYFMSGGSAFATNIILLYILTEYFKIYYLVSAVLSFMIAFVVSFLMMKHWTFQDGSTEKVNQQLVVYFGLAVLNLFLNSLLVYFFVEKVGVWYVTAQVVASLIIAVWNFFIYKYLIFIKPVSESEVV